MLRKVDGLFPDGYVYKPIFRVAALVLLLLLGVVFYQNDFSLSAKMSASCPSEARGGCVNDFYYCTHTDLGFERRSDPCPIRNKQGLFNDVEVSDCPEELCSRYSIEPGETLGEEPGWLEKNYFFVTLFVVLLAFLVNHLRYKMKGEKS